MRKRERIEQAMRITATATALLLLLLTAALTAADRIERTYYFDRPDFATVTIGGVTYDRIIMTNAPSGGQIGHPSLPAAGAKLLIPLGCEISSIEVIPGERVSLGKSFHIEPEAQPIKLSAEPGSGLEPVPDQAIYGASETFPASRFKEVGTHAFRGYQILTLRLQPVEYIPTTGELFYYRELTVVIHTVDSGNWSDHFRGLEVDQWEVQAMVDNPDETASYRVLGKRTDKSYDLLIITTPTLASSFQPLKDHHDSHGILTEIRTTTDVGSSDPDDIRAYITNAHDYDGIEYVLIGADDDIIPAKDLYVKSWEGTGAEIETAMPGDVFFGCLDGTWNYDGDSYWGEPTDGDGGGDVDLIAEVYVGRAAVGNTTEAARFVSKTLQYLNTSSAYLLDVMMVGEYLGFGGVSDYAGNMMEQNVDGSSADGYTTVGISSSDYNVDRLYEMDGSWSRADLAAAINDGLHVINHLGHGSPDYAMKFYDSDIMSDLTNTDHCLIYSQTCLAGHFDGTDCWAEYANIKTDAGAFAVIMNARYGWGSNYSTDGPSQRFNREFWDAVFNPAEGKPELGRANHDSKEDNLYRVNESCMRWVYYEENLFGDPTVSVRGAAGLAFDLPGGVPETVMPGVTTAVDVVVSAIGDGVPMSGSGQLHYSLNGGPLQTEWLTEGLPNEYQATLPAIACDDELSFYFSAVEATIGRIYYPDPSTPYSVFAATGMSAVFADNFETNQGWTVSGDASDGQWNRGTPVGGGDRGDPPTDFDGSGQCYLTDNVDDNSDVDGGTTILTSPTFDLDGLEAMIHYARWYSNSTGDDPNNDEMYVYISNNNGSNWTLVETIGPVEQASGGWYEYSFWVNDLITPTTQMMVKFEVSDLGSGSVVEAGLDDFSVTAYECSGNPFVVIETESLPQWTEGLAGYSATLVAANGTEPYVWSDKYGDLAGTGLSLSAAGGLTGTPNAAGTISFTAEVQDAWPTTDEKLLEILINPAPEVTTTMLPDWTVGMIYSQQLGASGGTGVLSWSDADNGLDGTGLVLDQSTGLLFGQLATAGAVEFTARVTDALGAIADQLLQFTINDAILITTEASLPGWQLDEPGYLVMLEASGGTGALTWTNLHNDLSGTGLTLAANGEVSGTPGVTGTIEFTAHVADAIGASSQKMFSIEIASAVQITTESPLPAWTANLAGYSVSLACVGGTEPFAWSDKNGDLIGSGLTLSGAGLLSGTPAAEGAITFIALVEDNGGFIDEREFSLTVNQWPYIDTETLPEWTLGVHGYSALLTGGGGTGALTWSDKNDDLAGTGFLFSSSGSIGGIPAAAGDHVFIAALTDAVGAVEEQELTIHVNEQVLITTETALTEGTEELPGYAVQLEATGGTGGLTWSQVGSGLQGTGLSLGSDGVLSGTPAAAGTIEFSAQAVDQLGDTDEKSFTIEVIVNWICGDADGNEMVNISDVTFLLAYIFSTGPAPDPLECANVNCDASVNISDGVYIIAYIFGGGPEPCASCPPLAGPSAAPGLHN